MILRWRDAIFSINCSFVTIMGEWEDCASIFPKTWIILSSRVRCLESHCLAIRSHSWIDPLISLIPACNISMHLVTEVIVDFWDSIRSFNPLKPRTYTGTILYDKKEWLCLHQEQGFAEGILHRTHGFSRPSYSYKSPNRFKNTHRGYQEDRNWTLRKRRY